MVPRVLKNVRIESFWLTTSNMFVGQTKTWAEFLFTTYTCPAAGIRRLHNVEIFEAIKQHSLTTDVRFFAFASRQYAAGDRSWLTYCMAKGESKVAQSIRTASRLMSAGAQLAFSAMSHLQVLEAALAHECICEGRAVPAWEESELITPRISAFHRPRSNAGALAFGFPQEFQSASTFGFNLGRCYPGECFAPEEILSRNKIDRAVYCAAVLELFRHGGGKGLNHFYVGPPSSGMSLDISLAR